MSNEETHEYWLDKVKENVAIHQPDVCRLRPRRQGKPEVPS